MNTFSIKDSILAKFEFAKFRESNKVYFDHRYNVSDAALKYLYILQGIQNYVNKFNNNKKIRVLELGCGDGHLLRIINQKFNIRCTGFDPILRSPRVKFSNLRRDKFGNRNELLSVNHIQFHEINSERYDIIFDSCSLTHFDTTVSGDLNSGWIWALRTIPNLIKPDGIFICATDVSDLSPNSEFVESNCLLGEFEKIGILRNISAIESNYKNSILDDLATNLPFLRIASSQDPTVVSVLGFEVSFS